MTSTPTLSGSVVELRQYTLHPGQGGVLADLFDREFLEPQEELGMWVIGQFRDLDDPDRFVWFRGFADMESRKAGLAGFYGGPVWAAHRDAANATMVDSDDVLLLKPIGPASGFPFHLRPSPPTPGSIVVVTVCPVAEAASDSFPEFFTDRVAPLLVEAGGPPIACLRTEAAKNNFPALPVREGENVFVWLANFTSRADLDAYRAALTSNPKWTDDVGQELSARLTGKPQVLNLAPTAGSRLR